MIGIIVDGPGEFGALRTRFRGNCKILVTDGPRGHTVLATKIVSKARRQIGMLRALGCSKVILVVNFENRRSDYTRFLSDIDQAIDNSHLDILVRTASPNQMFENWFLADIANLSKRLRFLRTNLKQKN